MGKSTIDHPFSIAMLVYQRVTIYQSHVSNAPDRAPHRPSPFQHGFCEVCLSDTRPASVASVFILRCDWVYQWSCFVGNIMRKPGFLPVIICVSFELIYHGPILRESINNEFALINKDTIYAWWFQAPDGCTQLRSSKMVENT